MKREGGRGRGRERQRQREMTKTKRKRKRKQGKRERERERRVERGSKKHSADFPTDRLPTVEVEPDGKGGKPTRPKRRRN